MIRKALAWLLLLTLLLSIAAAGGETSPGTEKHDVYDIYDFSTGGTTLWRGAAIPLLPGMAVTSLANLPGRAEDTGISDGDGLWKARTIWPLERGGMAFLFWDEKENPSSFSPWPVSDRTGAARTKDLYVYHVNATGDQMYRSVTAMSGAAWEGLDGMVVMLSGDAAPGDPILTEGGELAGMITAEYAEGLNRYAAVSGQGILNLLAQTYGNPGSTLPGSTPEEGFTVTAEGNRVTFDWSAVRRKAPEGMSLWLVVQDTGNDYLNYLQADGDTTSCTMLLTPGRTYISGLVASETAPASMPDRFAVLQIQEANRLTKHGFAPEVTGLVRAGDSDAVTERIRETVSEWTAEELKNGKVHFYSWSAYQVTEKEEDTLLITLTTPEGINYRYASGWVYDPSYMAEDIWSIPLSGMGFMRDLEKKGFSAGEYRMTYYVGGEEADSFVFSVAE